MSGVWLRTRRRLHTDDPRAGPRRGLGPAATLAVLTVALIVRVLYWRYATGGYHPASDAAHYVDIARSLAEGDGFVHRFPQLELHDTAFRPPLFPALLGAAFWLFGPAVTVGRLLNLVLSLVSVVLAMHVAGHIGADRRGQVVTGLAVAVFPPLVFNDVVLLTEPLSIVLLLTTVLLLATERLALAAVAAGLLVLSRTSAQLVLLLLVGWVLWQLGWRKALAFASIASLVVAPWAVRNAVQVGSLTLATSNGYNLAAMYGPPALDRNVFVDPVYDPFYERARLLQFDEAAWDRELGRIALDSILDRPTGVLRVAARNTAAFFELRPSYNVGAERLDGRDLDVRRLTVWLVPVLALAGTVALWRARRSPLGILLAALAGYFTVLSVLTIAAPRLRAPVDVLWCIAIGSLVSSDPAAAGGHDVGGGTRASQEP